MPLPKPMKSQSTDAYMRPQALKIHYRKTSNIGRTLVGNKIADHSDVVGAAPTTSSFST